MKQFLVGLVMIAGTGYGQQPQVTAPVKPEVAKPEVAAVKEYTKDVICQKGVKKNTYRITYNNVEGELPCKVYEIKDGKTKTIAESKKTVGVCEEVVDRIIKKLENSGMACDSAMTN